MIKYQILKTASKTGCLVIPMWEDRAVTSQIKEMKNQFGEIISEVWENKDFEAKKNQSVLLYTKNKQIPRLLLLGLGKNKETDVDIWKQAIGSAVVTCQGKKITNLALLIPHNTVEQPGLKKIIQKVVTAIEVANYVYDEYKTDKEEKTFFLHDVDLIGEFSSAEKKLLGFGVIEGQIIGNGVNFARHLGNTPPTIMTPALLASEAMKIAKENSKKIKVKILDRAEMKKLGMGCVLAVARGSKLEPKFIILEYRGAGKSDKPIVLVGKGVTYDSGGISLKPGQHLIDMKFDMLGAATVLAALKSAVELNLKKNIVVLIPAVENMPGGDAYRPDDILKAMNGKTIEIKNTDAEGRLILADALCYAEKYQPKEVIDVATLTGACMAALGGERSGIFSMEDRMVNKILLASVVVGEKLWRLPLGPEYTEAMKSTVADIKNTGGVGGEHYGGASTAAAFLQFFTNYPWLHIDLASALFSTSASGKPWIHSGANGFGVETLVEYLRQ